MKTAASNLILIGMSGSGKSYYGKRCAALLKLEFADTDLLIEEDSRRKVEELIRREGEGFFRDTEERIFRAALEREGIVLSTGGGIVEREANRQLLCRERNVVYLKCSPAGIARRLRDDNTVRPLLNYSDLEDSIASLLSRRERWYSECSDIVIDTDRLSEREVLDRILSFQL